MRIAALDYGKKRIGVALSDELFITAGALTVIERKDGAVKEPINRLGQIAEQYEVCRFIVGFPKNMDNSVGKIAQDAQKFAERLCKEIDVPVELWDERLTSKQAERALLENNVSRKKRKTKIDGVAATLILQSYLDSNGFRHEKKGDM